MTNEEFISSIKEIENTTKHSEFLSDLAKNNPYRLTEILKLIPKDQQYLLNNWQLRSVYEKIIKVAGFELDLEYIDVTNEIFNNAFREKDKNLIASVLAFKQEPLELIEKQIQTNNDELSELIIHELLSRNSDLSKSKLFDKIKDINSKSQFSELYLESSELEKENDFPSYASNGGGNGIAFGFQANEEYKDIGEHKPVEIDFEQSNQIVHAIEHWGGMSIGYKGNYQNSLLVEEIIMSMPEFLEAKKIRIRKLSASRAFALIFNASSNGSAYTTGYYGAHGRLRTWKTLNSMISNSKFISSIETEKKIIENKWYEFNTDNWFINEWLDLGIISVNEKSKEFGVIAATDTD